MSIKEFRGNISRHTTIALWVSFGVTITLGVWGFICPPKGIIDASVLEFGALLFGFASIAIAREAIAEGLGAKLKHGQTEIQIQNEHND